MTYARLTERASCREVSMQDHAPLAARTLDRGTILQCLFTLADQDGWNGESLCINAQGKAFAVPENQLEPILT